MTAAEVPEKARTKKKASKKSNKKKLTLSLDKEVIAMGKALAQKRGVSLSKLVEQFLQEKSLPVREPIIVIEPDPDILALMGKPSVPLAPKTNREYYDEYASMRRERYWKNSEPE
jgi:hypothetical protein